MAVYEPERFRPYLLMLARCGLRGPGKLRQKVDPSDLVQDALLKAVASRNQFRGTSEEEFAGWLRAILANSFADAARRFGRARRDVALEASFQLALDESAQSMARFAAPNTSPTEQLARLDRQRHVAAALEALPEDQREAVRLHHLVGLTVDEAAREMNRTRPAVAGLLRRGLAALRESLGAVEAGLR